MPKLVRDVVGGWILLVAVVLRRRPRVLRLGRDAAGAASTVLSAVLGFALQDVLKNLFAGMALQTELPFDTGDWLEVDGEPAPASIGMTWRSTHLRNTVGVDFREPNANLVSARGQEPRLRRRADRDSRCACRSPTARRPAGQGLAREGGPLDPGRGRGAGRLGLPGSASPNPAVDLPGCAPGRARSTPSPALRDHVLSRIWYQLHRDGSPIPYPVRTVQMPSRAAKERRRQGGLARAPRRGALGLSTSSPRAPARPSAAWRRARACTTSTPASAW